MNPEPQSSQSAPPDDFAISARRRVLLIAPHASYRTAAFIAAAQQLGAAPVVASEGRHSVIPAYAQGLHVDPADPAGALQVIVDAARVQPFAGIIGTDDVTTELAARAAAALGLRHNPPAAVAVARRKDLARERLMAAGVQVPAHRRLDLNRDLAEQARGFRYPAVLKPVALSASRGVIRVDTPQELVRAGRRIAAIVGSRPDLSREERNTVLLEAFVPGVEVAVEALLDDGRLRLLAIFDKPEPMNGPFFEETFYITPTRLDADTCAALLEETERACAAYGLREGPIHAECRINDQGVWIIEVAARTIGGQCARLLTLGTGVSLETLVLAQAMGERPEPGPRDGAAGVLMIPIPRAGVFRRVEGLLAAQRIPGIEDIDIQVREGHQLIPLPEGASYLGFIFARGATPGEVEAALRAAHGELTIVVAPLWRLQATTTQAVTT